MATWQSSKREFQVPCRCVIGRSTLSELRLESRRCSSEHATVTWSKGKWHVRDLGSSNGTKVNGRSLFPGDRVQISSGSTLQFGDDSEIWTVIDDEAPEPCAIELGPQTCVWGAQQLLMLPSATAPEASVFVGSGEWRADNGIDERTLELGDIVQVGSRYWRVLVPDLGGARPVRTAAPELELSELTLVFSASPAKIAVTLQHGAASVTVPARASLRTLAALARIRLRSGEPEQEGGWTSLHALADMLRCSPELVNLDVHRLRGLFQEVGVRNAAQLIERDDAKRLRIGIANLIERPDPQP